MIEKTECEEFRRRLKSIADDLGAYRIGETRPEVIANVVLAYRHLEDASMRLGGEAITLVVGVERAEDQ